MAQTLPDILTSERLAALREIASRYRVKELRVFGSYARGEARPDSDFDLLVDMEYGRGVSMRLVDFVLAVEALLGVRVDVVTERGLDRKLHARIFNEARAL